MSKGVVIFEDEVLDMVEEEICGDANVNMIRNSPCVIKQLELLPIFDHHIWLVGHSVH